MNRLYSYSPLLISIRFKHTYNSTCSAYLCLSHLALRLVVLVLSRIPLYSQSLSYEIVLVLLLALIQSRAVLVSSSLLWIPLQSPSLSLCAVRSRFVTYKSISHRARSVSGVRYSNLKAPSLVSGTSYKHWYPLKELLCYSLSKATCYY